ncbi:unnamed protein product [Adineta steineri]|uniref:NAD(P)(+)--arginine ADP-ribosyltransferase n=1 Tax=Adineta steineri TaxID=433720 RepID=A0A814X2B7_9BILA|nr:unnamed protein product [Adineta steineri]
MMNNYEQISIITLEDAVKPLVLYVPEVNDMVQLVKQKCQQPKENLSIDESASIMLYTMEWKTKQDSFRYICNQKLKSNNSDELYPWHLYLKLICISLSKLPTLSYQIFYCEVQMDLSNEYSLDTKFVSDGFLSCQLSIEAVDRTNITTLFIILSNQGKNISQHTYDITENEILLPDGQQFQVISNRTSQDGRHIIILRELPFDDSDELFSQSEIESITNRSFDLLFEQQLIKKYKHYSEINLRNQILMDDDIKTIVEEGIKNNQCTWLTLQNSYITSNGLFILADGLKMNKSLEALYLSRNLVDDIGVKLLTDIALCKYTSLTMLALDHNQIGNEGAQYLANMLKTNETLTDLWLSYNKIGDQGVQYFADVLASKNRTLMQLYLNGNKSITGLNTDSLVYALKLNATLNTLWLQDCNLSEESKQNLENSVEHKHDFYLNV